MYSRDRYHHLDNGYYRQKLIKGCGATSQRSAVVNSALLLFLELKQLVLIFRRPRFRQSSSSRDVVGVFTEGLGSVEVHSPVFKEEKLGTFLVILVVVFFVVVFLVVFFLVVLFVVVILGRATSCEQTSANKFSKYGPSTYWVMGNT